MRIFEKLKLYILERIIFFIRKFLSSKQVQDAAAGTLRFQKPFEHLHLLSLSGMNIGVGGNVSQSGEESALNYVVEKIKKENHTPVLFDVGANIGKYSLFLLQKFGSKTIIHAFEPAKATYQKLKTNVSDTGIRTYNVGIGGAHKTITLYYDSELSAGASVFNRRLEHFGNSMGNSEDIDLTTLTRFCEENKIDKIDLLKLDIEGNEFESLSAAKDLLANGSIRFIQFEFGGANIDSRTSFQDFWYLLSPYYNIYRIVKDGVFKIDSYKEHLELYMTTNFLAELKQQN